MKKLYTLFSIVFIAINSQAQIVISQVYGGGGNAGSNYSNDFIELFNGGSVAQSINGWSVQYASANGTTWSKTLLPNVTILPGQYYLIQQAAGATPSISLPTPDLNGMDAAITFDSGDKPLATGIAMSGSNGKVILVNTTTAETTADPTGPQIIDKVGYGTTNGFEGTGSTGTALTSITSAQRNNAGCTDTNNNASDFTAATTLPRNSSTAINTCNLSVKQNSISGLNVYPNPVVNGKLFITTDSNATKSIVIFDVLGKQVLSANVNNQALNVSRLNQGVYIIKITEEGLTSTRKLVIK